VTTAPSHRKASLQIRRDGRFRFAVVADTHGRPHPSAVERLLEQRPDAVLHAGDIGDLEVLDRLAIAAPVYAVRGNVDAPAKDLPDALTLDLVSGRTSRLRILLVHVAVYGPKLRADVARLARSDQVSLVVCGHSHVPHIGRDRGLDVFNPGSAGPRRFQLPVVFGVIDVTTTTVSFAHIDCETGALWTPHQPRLPIP
jgi:hypothetical protein